MKTALTRVAAIAAVLGFLMTPLIARADMYLNPKDGYFYHYVWGGCHRWGSSVRCDAHGSVSVWRHRQHNDDCHVQVQPDGRSWHVWAQSGNCTLHWVNNNTADIVHRK